MASFAETVTYVNSVVGRPYGRGAVGPEEYDCRGIAQEAERELFGRDLQILDQGLSGTRAGAIAAASALLRSDWQEAVSPSHGDLVTMRGDELHIGVYLDIDRGGVLHSIEGCGVRFDALDTLPALGFHRPRFYHYCGVDK